MVRLVLQVSCTQFAVGLDTETLCVSLRCLANGEIPPVKERLEYPVPPTESGLTPGKVCCNFVQGASELAAKSF